MPSPSVTYTFANSTTADATQVNTNFTDLINGMSDGTKDFSINALTCAGALTANGNVNLGNASGDDLTITASLASTINIKTTYSYDIGSATIGLRSVYLGSSDSAARSTRVIGATVASSWTLTLPTGAGTSGYTLKTDGSGVTSWVDAPLLIGARAYVSSNENISNSTTTTLPFGAESYDPQSAFASNTYTVPSTGYYYIHAQAEWAVNATGSRSIRVTKNGTSTVVVQNNQSAVSANSVHTIQCSAIVSLTAADTLIVRVSQDSGGTLAVRSGEDASFFEVRKVGN